MGQKPALSRQEALLSGDAEPSAAGPQYPGPRTPPPPPPEKRPKQTPIRCPDFAALRCCTRAGEALAEPIGAELGRKCRHIATARLRAEPGAPPNPKPAFASSAGTFAAHNATKSAVGIERKKGAGGARLSRRRGRRSAGPAAEAAPAPPSGAAPRHALRAPTSSPPRRKSALSCRAQPLLGCILGAFCPRFDRSPSTPTNQRPAQPTPPAHSGEPAPPPFHDHQPYP